MPKPAKNNTKQGIPWLCLIIVFFTLRGLTLLAAIIGSRLLVFKNSFPYADSVLLPYGQFLLWSWANFDGVHYLLLAEKGYAFGLTQAFFPVYPLLIKA